MSVPSGQKNWPTETHCRKYRTTLLKQDKEKDKDKD